MTTEAEVYDHILAEMNADRWLPGKLYDGVDSHCLLGMIGHAVWGAQWNLDCTRRAACTTLYHHLKAHPASGAAITRLARLIAENDDSRPAVMSPSRPTTSGSTVITTTKARRPSMSW